MGDSKTAKTFGIAGCYAVFLAAALWLLFYHLDSHLLWGDEAETAVLAKSVAQFGVPRTFDGTNYLILNGTIDETPGHIWVWAPWLPYYVTANSFLVFGPTTWAARAPFAFAGWCCLIALGSAAFRIYRSHWIALAGMTLLGGSEIFLLHARQCRYYSISVFAEILLIYGAYQLFVQNKRGVWPVALALTLQFYSNYLIAAANVPALIFLAWMLREHGKRAVLHVATALAIPIVAFLPWLVYAHPGRQARAIGHGSVLWATNYFLKAWDYLVEIHFHFMPLCFLLLPLAALIWTREKEPATESDFSRKWERWLLFLLASYFGAMLMAPGFYLRYQLPLLPVLCLLAAAWVFRHVKWRALAVFLIVVQISSNVFSLVTAYPLRQGHALRFPLMEYVDGLMTPYTDRFADVLDFFKAQARPGERVLTFDPEFPLVFYTQLGVINGWLMGPPPGQLPDWILPVPASGVVARDAVALPEFLKPHYETITIPVHDSKLGDSFPEPDNYQYHTAQTRVPFIIYKLKAEAGGERQAQNQTPGR